MLVTVEELRSQRITVKAQMVDFDLKFGDALAQLVVLVEDLARRRPRHELGLELALLLLHLAPGFRHVHIALHLQLLELLDVPASDLHELLLQGLDLLLRRFVEDILSFALGEDVKVGADLFLHVVELV